VTSVQFEPDGDVITADSDGFITIYSVDADGAYFVRMEFEAHTKGISCLIMLSEGTLLSGGDKDRRIVAWDSLQNYKKICEIKVGYLVDARTCLTVISILVARIIRWSSNHLPTKTRPK
jgi:microtubule-associated protein-like 1/2